MKPKPLFGALNLYACVGVRTLPNDHAYVISMQPGRAWTHLLDNNRACTSRGRVSSWGFRPTARVILSTHMPCAVECFGIMWLYMHPSRSLGRCGCKYLSDTDGTRVGARTVVMEHVHTICRCSMRVRVRRAHARRAAPCSQIARMVPQRRRWGLCGCMRATH